MPRHCTICDHPERAAIDEALAAGAALAALSREYHVSEDALARHRTKHLPQALMRAHEAQTVADADSLLDKVAGLEADAHRIGAAAEKSGDLRTALAAVRELIRIAELLGRLVHELGDTPAVGIVVVQDAAAWAQMPQGGPTKVIIGIDPEDKGEEAP